MKYQLRWYVVVSHATHNDHDGYVMERNVYSGEALYPRYVDAVDAAVTKMTQYPASTLLELKIIPWSD